MDASNVIPKLPVLILGGGPVTGTSVARIFAQAGFETHSIERDPGLSAYSRYYRQLKGSSDIPSEPALLPELLGATTFQRAFLIACSDDWMSAVAAVPEDLRTRFLTCAPSPPTIETLLNKWQFGRVLKHLNIPHPRNRLITSMKELEALDPSEFAAAFLKPLNSLKFFKAHGVKALLFRSKDEAIQHAQRFGFPIMLQEFIAGPPTAHYFIDGFVDRSGRTLARFTRQRIRMSPPLFGNSTSTVSIPSERVLPAAESLELLFRELAYHGIFNAEFKYDERDGLFKLLEVNARPWIYVGFAARARVNVCLMAYRDALGLPVEAVSEFELGRCCVDVLQDLRAFRYGRKQRGESVWSWLKFIISADKISFRWTDPAVALISFISFLKGQFQRRPRLWMRKLTPPLSGPFDVKVQLPTTSDPRLRKAL